MKHLIILLLLNLASFASSVQANTSSQQDTTHKVYFSISQSDYFNNDRVSITFSAFAQDKNPQVVANSINTQMQNATSVLKHSTHIKLETGNYQIIPVYNKNRDVVAWRGQQTLSLNMPNLPGLVKTLTKVQPFLRYQSMSFGVSETQRQKFINQLTQEAIKAYQQKANMIATSFRAQNYRITETRINTPHIPTPYKARSAMMADTLTTTQISPTLKQGQTKLTVSINGQLEIQ